MPSLRPRVALATALLSAAACAESDDPAPGRGVEDWVWELPAGFPVPKVPEDNPMSQAKVDLGRRLFYDTRLSGNATQSCGSCHEASLGLADGRALALGSTGEDHFRNSMGLTNVAYMSTLTWVNPQLDTLEKQFLVPMFGEFPVELGITGNEDEVLARFTGDAEYAPMFAEAFPDEADPVRWDTIVKSMAAFSRTMISGDSRFDRWAYQDDRTAMSDAEIRGMDLFFSERLECHHCHGGFNFALASTHEGQMFNQLAFHNTGLYNVDGNGAYPTRDPGLFELTGRDEDMGRFRAPSLRNVALTAPYLHDGSAATLEEVIDIYAAGGRLIEAGPDEGDGRVNPFKSGFVGGFSLTPEEKADLIAFLNALTDEDFLAREDLSDPWL